VNVHLGHQPRLLHKLSFAIWQLYLFHHDQSSSNAYHPFHLVLVRNIFLIFLHIVCNIFICSTGDIIIERWIPYGAQAKRRTIVQRAAGAQQYAAPRNIIIQYEAVQVRVVRQFQRLGVTQFNPQVYLQQYGATLLDAATLLQQARAAGVVEDIVSFHVYPFR
jgi:hypothetical protein